MIALPWIFVVVMALVILAVFVPWYHHRFPKGKLRTDYYAFFIMGIAFIPVGIVLDNPGLWGAGTIFAVLGLVNRDKWNKREHWSAMSSVRKRLKVSVLIGLIVLIALGMLAFFMTGK